MKDKWFHCTCGWFQAYMPSTVLSWPNGGSHFHCVMYLCRHPVSCWPSAEPQLSQPMHITTMTCSVLSDEFPAWILVRTSACILTGTPAPWQTNHGQLCYHEICTLLHTPTPTPTANYPQPPPGHSSAPLCFSREKKEGEGKNTPTAIFFSHLSGVKTTPWPYTAQVVRGSLKSNQETTDGKTDKLQGRKKRSNQLAPIIVDDNL